jgi:hypothetical protein
MDKKPFNRLKPGGHMLFVPTRLNALSHPPSSSAHVYTQVFRFTILGVWERMKIDEICGSGHPAANNRALFAAGWPLPQLMYNDESSSVGMPTLKLSLM